MQDDTTSMIALVLERAGSIRAVIGGRLSAFGSKARLAARMMVAEADERIDVLKLFQRLR